MGSSGQSSSETDITYSFGPYVFYDATLELHRDGRIVELQERPARVLRELLRHHGHVVTKENLLDTAWNDVIVTDDALFHAIRELRKLLGDDARKPTIIQTVHRRGYRFIAEVHTGPEPGAPAGSSRSRESGMTPESRRAGPPLLRAGLLVGLMALGALLLVPHRSRTSGPEPRLHELLRWRHGLFKPVYSPRGELLAAVAPDTATGIYSIFLVKPGLEEALQLTRDLEVRGPAPVFSPDGTQIYFTVYGAGRTSPTIWRVPVLGGEPGLFLENATAVSFEPGGQGFVVTATSPEGSTVTVHHPDGSTIGLSRPGYWPRWSPDGRWIAWTTSDPEGGDGHLLVARPDGSSRRRLTTRKAQHYGLSWTRDSEGLVLASNSSGTFDLWYIPLADGSPQPLTVGADNATSPTVRQDGRRIVFCRGTKLDGVAILADAHSEPRWIVPRDHVAHAAIAPGGTAVAVLMERPADREIVLFRGGSWKPRVLGTGPLEDITFTPDGHDLLVTVSTGDGSRVERWPYSGTGNRKVLFHGTPEIGDPVQGPGGILLFVQRGEGSDRLIVRDLATGRERLLATGARIEAPRISPDGTMVAYSGGYRPPSPASAGVWLVPLDGSAPPTHLWPDGAWPCWEPGNTSLVFARYFESEGLWRISLDGRKPHRLRRSIEGLTLWSLDCDPVSGTLLVRLEVQVPTLWALDEPQLGSP